MMDCGGLRGFERGRKEETLRLRSERVFGFSWGVRERERERVVKDACDRERGTEKE